MSVKISTASLEVSTKKVKLMKLAKPEPASGCREFHTDKLAGKMARGKSWIAVHINGISEGGGIINCLMF